MSRSGELRNVAASVRQRLLNFSREKGVDFQAILHRFAAERFLYRLSISPEVDRFTLKGAALFRIWTGQELRATRDVDFLGTGAQDIEKIRSDLETICTTQCPEDGVTFDPQSIRVVPIRNEQNYGGLRARLQGVLGTTRLTLQVDIGFGDVITPEPIEAQYPTLVELPAPRLWTYPRSTLVAEKFEAMVSRGAINTRMKDFWDIACLARRFDFDGEELSIAIRETFTRRGTRLASERPEVLTPDYYQDPAREKAWHQFRQQVGAEHDGPARFVDAGEELRGFLVPACDHLLEGADFTRVWPAGGPWRTHYAQQAEINDD